MKTPKLLIVLSAIYAFLSITTGLKAQLIYPSTRYENVTDNYFGTIVKDPYRWLENDTSSNTRTWIQTQQKFTENYLSKIPFREVLHNHLRQIYKTPRYYYAEKVGEYIIYRESDGIQNQPVYYIQKGLQGEPRIIIDPNKLSTDGSISVALNGFSNNKKYLAYHINKGGSDWQTIYVMDIASQTKLNDEINWVKGGLAWCGNGFYYGRYDKPAAGTELSAKNEFEKIYYHSLGDNQDNDKLIYEDKNHPDFYIEPQVTEDERYLFIYLSHGTYGNEILYKDLTKNTQSFKSLFTGFDFNYSVIDNVQGGIIVYTNNGADNYRVIEVDILNPGKEYWKDIVAERPERLESANTAGGKLFCSYLKNAYTLINEYTLDGTFIKQIDLPGIGSSSGIGGFKDDTYSFYSFSSFTNPSSLYSYDIINGKSELFKKSVTNIKTDDYTTDQVYYTSRDGTKVPMFIVHNKNLKLNIPHPTLLYAYGGFDVSITPNFSPSIYILLEQNGIYAVANIRGGGEYGEKWHKGGNLLNKQNVFDDFTSAAEYLISNNYTSKDLLAINGGSNGGLLVGAVMTQHPELFKVALPEVGVMDMLRFQKFTVGWGWTVEYGTSDSAKYFPYIYKYSPLHNIKKDVSYPATMIFTADHDDRVVPAHSFKFGATLQAAQSGNNPVLIRITTNQGHGASGSSLEQVINKESDKWSFMFYNMGIVPNFK